MIDPPSCQEPRSVPRGHFDSSSTGPPWLELRDDPGELSIEIERFLAGACRPFHPPPRRHGLERAAHRGQGSLEIDWALSMRGGERFEMSRHRLSELPCGREPTMRAPVIDEGQKQEKDALHVAQATLKCFELARSELELRLVEQALRLAEIVRHLVAQVIELAIRACPRAITATQAREGGQRSEHGYEPLRSAVACRHRPKDALQDAEDQEAERNADDTVPCHRELGHRAPPLQENLVEGQPDLISAVRDAWAPEVHPRRHRRARGEDCPESSESLHVGQDVHQREDAHDAAYRR